MALVDSAEEGDRRGLPRFRMPFVPTMAAWEDPSGADAPLTLRERLICHVMASVMQKPGWIRKVQDEALVSKWKEELRESDVPHHLNPDFEDEGPRAMEVKKVDDEVIDYAIAELQWMARCHDGGPVEPSPVQGVYIVPDATSLLDSSGDARKALLAAVKKMEDIPEDQIDYHPGTNNQVIDLVHPSLYCLAYGHTRLITTDPNDTTVLPWSKMISAAGEFVAHLPPALASDHMQEFVSHRFQWLPSELDIPTLQGDLLGATLQPPCPSVEGGSPPADQGCTPTGAKFRSYINNLHPRQFPELYPALASIFHTCFVPLFNKVLTDLVNPRPLRLEAHPFAWYDNWKGEREYDMDNDDEWEAYHEDRQPEQPKIPAFEPPLPIPAEKAVDLRGRRLQVIVKISEIRLTPEQPTYPGGKWHVEGMKNESIVATGIYYFDSHNIQNSKLSFRRGVDEPDYEQSDNKGVQKVYGLENDMPLIQSLGAVGTSESGLCLAFPNLFHHRVSPFTLADPSRPGHRKILAFFLVDPGERVFSTAHVPPQQAKWREMELEQAWHPYSHLPAPALEIVAYSYCSDVGALSDDVAKSVRLELMHERKVLLDEATEEVFERPFSLCEH